MDADVLIVGAGCAGLSLAVHLLDAGASDLEIVLLDRRETHVRDRTWCYWSGLEHPFAAAESHSWHRWKVITSAGEVERGSPSVAYRCIPADAFYDLALERLERSPNVRLVRGTSVEGFRETDAGVAAVTAMVSSRRGARSTAGPRSRARSRLGRSTGFSTSWGSRSRPIAPCSTPPSPR